MNDAAGARVSGAWRPARAEEPAASPVLLCSLAIVTRVSAAAIVLLGACGLVGWAADVAWLEADITSAALPPQAFDVWHDRAVFHFLADAEQRARYVTTALRAVKPGGHVIVAAFAPDGPSQCSGLPTVRYAPEALHDEFGARFELLQHVKEAHHTPLGSVQQFVYCLCRRSDAAS